MSLLTQKCVLIENDTELFYCEKLLENLAVKEIYQIYALDNILSIMGLLIAIGAMLATFSQVDNSNFSIMQIVVMVILGAVFIYGVVAQCYLYKNKKELPETVRMIEKSIESYKKGKKDDEK